ncbi:MAG: type II/IV secretion system ATPase subunit [Candidatus Micrarchaeota archaeon]|nr:type II/IV secretion system ATPase subunit [Candidatus Micrarchaeota archaeon]
MAQEKAESYTVNADGIEAHVSIVKKIGEIPLYSLDVPKPEPATAAYLETIKSELLRQIRISTQEVLDIKLMAELRQKFYSLALKLVKERIPRLSEQKAAELAGKMVQDLLGLGEIEYLLKDDFLEEICVNSSREPIWVYHKKYGWCKSNLQIESESKIWDYSSLIGRRVGRQITAQDPLLDAYLPSGDRVNATLSPISMFGNTITIRKFARKPWTITDLLLSNTISEEVAAFVWLAMQYELNILISGGTGAGKTSMLNVLCSFLPQNQRVISIEQTREITLPSYLQWVPMVVRQGGRDGRGDVSMLDLMVNSLRMRPDRIIVGEIRRAEEAEVLFEAMHTGHSVYATMHAETVFETFKRLVSPPIELPEVVLESLHFVLAMYRDRRSGIRRVFEIGELIPSEKGESVRANIIYRWRSSRDRIEEENPSVRLLDTLRTYTRMDDGEIKASLKEREKVLHWLASKKINSVEEVGKTIVQYYEDPESLMKKISR